MSISRELSVYFYCLITIDVSKIGGCTFERNLTPAASLRCVYLRTTKYRQFGVSSCHKSTEKFAVLLLIGCSFCDCTGHIKFVTVPGTLSLWLYRTSPARDCTGQVQPVTVSDTSSFMSVQLSFPSDKILALVTRNGSESLQCPSVAKCSVSHDVSCWRVTACRRRS